MTEIENEIDNQLMMAEKKAREEVFFINKKINQKMSF